MTEDSTGNVLDVGRRTRTIPSAIARALRQRDGGCRFPKCTCERFVAGHHVIHWADGGEAKLDNLQESCGPRVPAAGVGRTVLLVFLGQRSRPRPDAPFRGKGFWS